MKWGAQTFVSKIHFLRNIALFAIAIFAANQLPAQDAGGRWQATLLAGGQKLRIVLQIENGGGHWRGTLYSIDQTPNGMPVTTLSISSNAIKFTVEDLHIAYQGKFSADGHTITGTLTQGTALPLNFERASNTTAWKVDASPHKVQFIPVEGNIRLEVLDWGGTGRPLVLLTGLGDDAHVYDSFAPKLARHYHVFGITRRGFGASSAPSPANTSYTADRLGDDVLAVIEALHLNRPVLVGHSIAGEELSSIGTRHPEKVAVLIYLDAGMPYAIYDNVHGNLILDSIEVRKQLDALLASGTSATNQDQFLDAVLANVNRLKKDIQEQRQETHLFPPSPSSSAPSPVISAITAGEERYYTLHVPTLAIFAVPHDLGDMFQDKPEARAAMEASDLRRTEEQSKAFEMQVPTAHVVRFSHASHYIFRSNEADTIREIDAFLSKLPMDEPSTP